MSFGLVYNSQYWVHYGANFGCYVTYDHKDKLEYITFKENNTA